MLVSRIVTSLLAAAMLLPAAAHAQLSSAAPPPPVIMTDSNGVDLKSGNFTSQSKPIGLGAADDPAVAYTALDANYNNNAGTPMIGWIQHYTCGLSDDGCVEYLVARLGNKVLTFRRPPGEVNLVAFSGERLVSDPVLGAIIYDNEDTGWVFGSAFVGSGNESYIYQSGTLQKIIYKDGRTLTYARAGLDMSVTSNQGYQLIVRSAHQNVKMINTAVDYCDITASSCTYSQNWPTFTRTGSTSGNVSTTYATDPMSRTTTMVVSSVTGSGGYTDTHLYRPGGLHQYFRKQNVTLYAQGGQSAAAWLVTNYSDDFGSSAYSYSSTLAQLGTITHAVSTRSDGGQTVFNNYFDDNSLTDELGNATHYYFGSDTMQPWSYGRIEALISGVKYPEQGQIGYSYDARGNIVQTTATPKPGSGQAAVSATAGWRTTCIDGKTCHIPDYTIDARNARTDFTYNASGMILTKTLPPDANGIRQQTRYTWQQLQAVYKQSPTGAAIPSGAPVWKLMATSTCRTMAGAACVGSADEVRTTYAYNGNLLQISDTVQAGDGSISATTTRDYDIYGNLLWIDGPAAGAVDRTYYFWNASREPVGEIGPDPDTAGPLTFTAVRRTFDAEGRLTLSENGTTTAQTLAALNAMTVQVSVATTYDKRNQKLTERRFGGSEQTLVQYSYGYKGLLECTAVRMNPATYGALPASACVQTTQGSFGPDRIVRNYYDAAGRLTQIRRGVGTPLEQVYAAYTHNAGNLPTSVTDANGNVATMTYDGFDRQTFWRFPSKTTAGQVSATDYEQYGYDNNGNRTSLRKRDGRVFTFTYDPLNRMIAKVVPDNCVAGFACTNPAASAKRDVYFGYDLRGLQTSALFEDGQGVTNGYDPLGRLTSSTTNMGGFARTVSFVWDIRSNKKRVIHPDGNYFVYRYDELDRMAGVGANSTIQLGSAVYNAQGQLQNAVMGSGAGSSGAITYGHDGVLRRNSAVQTLSSGTGNLTTTLTYTPSNQIATRTRSNTAYAFTGYTPGTTNYTTNGLNQYPTVAGVSLGYDDNGNMTSTGPGGTSFTYDADNRLVAATGSQAAEFVYDPLGRLFQSSVNGGSIAQFLYDGDKLIAEYDGAGTLLRRYAHGAAADSPMVQAEGSGFGSLRYFYPDQQGSVIAIADAAGVPLAINTYDEYGVGGTANSGRFRFTGQMWIPELGIYYYKARMYSPRLGRFLQTDPIGYKDQIHLYAYVGNDPLNRADPTGLCQTNSRGEEVGLCGNDEYSRNTIAAALADPNAKATREAEARLVRDGVRAGYRSGTSGSSYTITDVAKDGNSYTVRGYIRRNEKEVVVSVSDGKISERAADPIEQIEHEADHILGVWGRGTADDAVNRYSGVRETNFDEARATNTQNAYLEASGKDYRRYCYQCSLKEAQSGKLPR